MSNEEVDLRVGQCGTEVFPDVGFKNRVKVLELSVRNQSNYKDLSETGNETITTILLTFL